MAPLPYSDTGAEIAFYAVFGSFIVLEWLSRLRSRFNRPGPREEQLDLALVVVFITAGLVGGFALAVDVKGAAIRDARWPVFAAGLVLLTAGIAIRQWAIAVLGRYFTTDVRVRPGQVVVDRGPYRWVRHPSYTGLIVTFVGLGLALGNWAALAVLAVVPTVGLVIRSRHEERVLLDGLGEPYRRFAATRARLIPGVW